MRIPHSPIHSVARMRVHLALFRPSGQLQTSAALDYETKSSYSVSVSVSDGNGGSDSITVTVNVTNVSEPPTPPVRDRTAQVRDAIVAAAARC